MVKTELVKRSPLRIFEKSIHGALPTGKLGMIASRKGVGKTACLVHIATDQLLQGKHVIHVSFATKTDHIVSWYEDIFKEIARKRDLDNAMDVHDELIRNRVIMNFSQEGVGLPQVVESLRAMVEQGNFNADILMFDGYNFEKGSPEDLDTIQKFAAEEGLAVWVTATLHREDPSADDRGVPTLLVPYVDHAEVLVTLTPTERHVKLTLVKDQEKYPKEDLHLILDPKTLLIAEEA
jgi:KaiC/GvpD/RAD55 family RecA-like ATPase